MNRALFEQKSRRLYSQADIQSASLEKFLEAVSGRDDWGLRRVNPLRFAEEHGLGEPESVDLFVHASRAGLFDFSWNLLCPSCGGYLNNQDTVRGIMKGGSRVHCHICDIEVPADLDDYVEVSFTISPEVHEITIDPGAGPSEYFRYYFSPNLVRNPEFQSYIETTRKAFVFVRPGETAEVRLEAEPDSVYRITSIVIHSEFRFRTDSSRAAGEQRLRILITENGYEAGPAVLSAGTVVIEFVSGAGTTVGNMLFRTDFEVYRRLLREQPSSFLPFLTGKRLLNTQSFRDLFKIQDLPLDLSLSVRSLTLLFTDLKGSTDLYERTGDLRAYGMIQDHFRVLSACVRKCGGAIIKTMGDAIMAAFSQPADGLRAAVDMMNEIRALRHESYDFALKIGLHEGPALVINNDNRLDYFGQTVNIAARVQALADANEIYITETIASSCGARDGLLGQGFCLDERTVSLKGVGGEIKVFRCFRE